MNVYLHKNGFHIKGHAEYAEYGQDIVCASISVLAQVLAREITTYIDSDYYEKSGDLKLVMNEERLESKVLLRTFVRGVREIARQYPDNVKIFASLENLS